MSASFFDRVIHWATTRRMHWWLLIGYWVVALAAVNVGVAMAGGTLGTHLFYSAESFYAVYGLVAYAYLTTRAGHAFDRFRPALAENDQEATALRHKLTALPPRLAIGAALFGAAAGLVSAATDPQYLQVVAVSVIGGLLVGLVDSVINLAIAAILLVQILRILLSVTRLHRRADYIDLFNPDPAHAFSGVTALAGGLLIGAVTYSALTDPTTFTNPFVIGLVALTMIVGVLVFTLPLAGMRRRLIAQREALLIASRKRIHQLGAVIGTAVDEGRYEDVGQLETALGALERDRENIAKTSTWPWEGATLSRFGAALLVPLLTWLITNALGRLLDL